MNYSLVSVMSYQVSTDVHKKQTFLVHQLLQDFIIEDVWQFPIVIGQNDNFDKFKTDFLKINDLLMSKGLVALLFKIRLSVGKLLKWDKKEANHILRKGSIRERFAKLKNLSPDQLEAPGDKDFVPVYSLENESLAEIDNSTVHAALHLGEIRLTEFESTVQMAVYVKPKGLFGKVYMLIIKPFRLWIVYPMIMKTMHQLWNQR